MKIQKTQKSLHFSFLRTKKSIRKIVKLDKRFKDVGYCSNFLYTNLILRSLISGSF